MKAHRKVLGLIIALGVISVALVALAQETTAPAPIRQPKQLRWDEEAEQTLGMGRGLGRQLMTQEEWEEHRQKMRTMTPEEREKYRQDHHQKMMERAKERGISIPETPGPRGRMGGRGMGGHGMGKGQGGGRGR